jgi:hypothetical protein
MDDKSRTAASTFLSYVLRHEPDAVGISLDSQGWVSVHELPQPLDRAPSDEVSASCWMRRSQCRTSVRRGRGKGSPKTRKAERAAAEVREVRLKSLASREEEAWSEVGRLVSTKMPINYDAAVQMLSDLRELDSRRGTREFSTRLKALRELHYSKVSFQRKLKEAAL